MLPLPAFRARIFISHGRHSMKFPRAARLLTQAQFRYVFDKPIASRDQCFTVLHKPNGHDDSRLGMAVSRKNCKTATGRNRIKRQIRESFRAHQQQLAENGGRDLVVLSTRQTATICNSGLASSLEKHWQRISRQMGQDKPNPDRNHK